MTNAFDIPQSIKNILDKAIEIDMIEIADVYALAMNSGGNWDALINEIQNIAYANIHCDPEVHYAMCRVCDKHYAKIFSTS